jgi:hypothetical protein
VTHLSTSVNVTETDSSLVAPAPLTATTPLPTSTTSPTPQDSKNGLSKGALAGMIVGGTIVVLGLVLWALLAWTGLGLCLKRGKTSDGKPIISRPTPNSVGPPTRLAESLTDV